MHTLTAADLELAHTVRLAVMRLSRQLRRQRSDASLTHSQTSALAVLDRLGPLTPGALADQENVQPPTMTKLVAGLEARGQVTTSPHPSDGRQKFVAVTPAAHAMLEGDRNARDAWLAQRMATLSTAEVATLRAASTVLEKLQALP
ncbi:MAG TPA: MarR family transcriptional regulator [Sporichthyaceae bacterium]